jgi:CheY-like chemotaxis protein
VAEPRIAFELEDIEDLAQINVDHGEQFHTLLYVEDNPANLVLVQLIIARHPDMQLLTAMNGNSGIEIACASLPDVIMMDINLPDINGYEALKILHSDPDTAHIPVIAISANAMPRDINEFTDALHVALDFSEKHSGKGK